MSKVIAFIYAFLILFQSFNISLEDFSKINALFEHAQFHKEMYGDSFYEFLAEHYGNAKDKHTTDHKNHEDLPFKGTHHICAHSQTPFIDSRPTFTLTQQDFITIPFNFFYTEPHTNFEKPSVFQPPKHA